MTDEQLKIANDLKSRINRLDEEIYQIMDVSPAIRSTFKDKTRKGWFQKLKGKSLIQSGVVEKRIELTNEDCRALIDIRTAEREALQQVLSNIN